jgi:hypothetical protein
MGTVTLTEQQAEIYSYLFKPLNVEDPNSWRVRNAVVCASRGFGKSYLAGTVAASAISQLEMLDAGVPNKQVVIVAPTLGSVTSIYKPLLDNQFNFKDPNLAKYNGNYYTYTFKNNSKLMLFSFEMIERLRGQGVHTLICDELTSWSNDDSKVKEAWESVIYPCVTTRWSPMRAKVLDAHSPGRSLIISTPKGFNTFYDLFQMKTIDKDWKSWHFNYLQSPFLSKEEIEKVRRSMDPMKFNREYEASFEESGAQVYHCFDRRVHVKDDLTPIQHGEQLFIGLDFNVDKMATTISVERAGNVYVLDEMIGAPNTEEWCARIWKKYGKTNPIAVFPDPSGNSNKTSATAGTTDFSIIQNSRNEYEWRMQLFAKKAAPKVVDSVASVNKMLLNAHGESKLFVHTGCINTIRSLERTVWMDNNPNTAIIDKKQDIEHMSDGLRYYIDYRHPALVRSRSVAVGALF